MKTSEKADNVFDARLWKIGGSVVFTLPSGLQSRFYGDFVEIIVSSGGKTMTYIMMPWKCGGSYVVTVPKQYVLAYRLDGIIKEKGKVGIKVNPISRSGG